MNDKLLTVKEVAYLLRLNEKTLRNKICANEDLPISFLVGNRRRFMKKSVEDWINEKAKQNKQFSIA